MGNEFSKDMILALRLTLLMNVLYNMFVNKWNVVARDVVS